MTLSPRAPPKTTLQNEHSLLVGGQKGLSVPPLHGHATLASQDALLVLASYSPRPERSRVPQLLIALGLARANAQRRGWLPEGFPEGFPGAFPEGLC